MTGNNPKVSGPMGRAVVWRSIDGAPVACIEKNAVLARNLEELVAMASDALDDAVLMGVDPEQVRQVFAETMTSLSPSFPKN